jgi:transposase
MHKSIGKNILEASVVSHFDNHPLNTRPVFMDDNARPHRARVVTDYLRDESITTLPWPTRSPDLNNTCFKDVFADRFVH